MHTHSFTSLLSSFLFFSFLFFIFFLPCQLPFIVFDIDFHVGEALDTYATKKALNAKPMLAVPSAPAFAAPGN